MRLLLLPRLGADGRLFWPQRSAFPDLLVPAWISPRENELLPDYAARLAETVRMTKPIVVGGSSFGGMVACEMAPYLDAAAVVLIGSCRSRQGVRPVFRALRPFAAVLPSQVIELVKPLSPLVVGTLSRATEREHRQLCVRMFKDADSRFMKWAFTAVCDWRPTRLEGIRVFQIHGQKDLAIPAKRVEADRFVVGGGHLINLTHPEEVNRYLASVIEQVRSP